MAHTEGGSPASPELGQPGYGLAVMSTVGLFFIDGANFMPWNVSGRPFVMAGGALLLGTPGYLAQRSHLSEPAPVPPYQRPRRVSR
jgi:hypothetical protein